LSFLYKNIITENKAVTEPLWAFTSSNMTGEYYFFVWLNALTNPSEYPPKISPFSHIAKLVP